MISRRMAIDGVERGEGGRAITASRALRTARGVAAMAGGIAVGAQVEVWMEPVPMTLQTFALVVGAALLGPGLGAAAAALYVALAAVGVPVLAGWRALPARRSSTPPRPATSPASWRRRRSRASRGGGSPAASFR